MFSQSIQKKVQYCMDMHSAGEQTLEVMREAKWYNQWLFKLIKPEVSGNILEVGAGIGNFTKLLSSIGKVTATDYEHKYLSHLKKKPHKNIKIGFGDIEKGKYFFTNERFDTVVALNVIEHIKDDKKAITNINHLLNTKGKFIMLVPAHKKLFSKFDQNIGHFRRYTTSEVSEKLKEAGFKKVKVRYLNWFGAIGWFMFLKFGRSQKLPLWAVKVFDLVGKLCLLPEKVVKFPFGLSVYAVAQK